MNKLLIVTIFAIILLNIGNIASARTLVTTTIDYSQYGTFLGERGFGNVLYNHTYDDGVYILEAKLGIKLPTMSLYGDNSPADIHISTHVSGPTQSGKYAYYFMYCDSEVIYQHEVETRRSDRCGDTIIKSDQYTPENFLIFQNNLVQRAMCYVDLTMDVDRIFINGVQWYPPQKGTLIITSTPTGATVSDTTGTLGVTPLTISKNDGTYNFTFSMNGYESASQTSTFTNGIYGGVGSSNTVNFVLTVRCPRYSPPYCPDGTLISQGLDDKGCQKPLLCSPTIHTLWWYDNTHDYCQLSNFNGSYMYLGLYTFPTESECKLSLVGKTTPTPTLTPTSTMTPTPTPSSQKCIDGTLFNTCSLQQPLYCDNKGNLYANTFLCGCPPDTFKSGDICKPGSEWGIFNILLIIINWIKSLFGV